MHEYRSIEQGESDASPVEPKSQSLGDASGGRAYFVTQECRFIVKML